MLLTNLVIFIFVIFSIFVLAVIILFRLKKKKLADLEAHGTGDSPDGYNLLQSTQRIAEMLANRGIRDAEADALLNEARRELDSGRSANAAGLATRARALLAETQQRSHAGPPVAAEDADTQEVVTMVEERRVEDTGNEEEEDDRGEDLERFVNFSTDDYVNKKDNKMPARFTIGLAEDELDAAASGGMDVARGREFLAAGKAAMLTGDFDLALRQASRARRCAKGEEVGDEPAAPMPVETESMAAAPGPGGVCRECGNELAENDNFCGKCGARNITEKRCPGCGEVVRDDDAFCRKCGTRLNAGGEMLECPECGGLAPVGSGECPHCGVGFG